MTKPVLTRDELNDMCSSLDYLCSRVARTAIAAMDERDELRKRCESAERERGVLCDAVWDLHDEYAPRSCKRISPGFHTDCDCGFSTKLDALRAKEQSSAAR